MIYLEITVCHLYFIMQQIFLGTYSMTGSVLSSVDAAMNKKERIPVLWEDTGVCMCDGAMVIDISQLNKWARWLEVGYWGTDLIARIATPNNTGSTDQNFIFNHRTT